MAKSLLQRIGLLGLSLVLTLVLAEGIFRLFPGLLSADAHLRVHWREMLASTETRSIGHPHLGFVYPAHHRAEIRHGEVAFGYSTDARGFRNTGTWPARAEIVVVGDSLTFSYGVENDEGWIQLLSGRLPRSRILNLGLIGAAPQQYLRFYEEFGTTLRPNLLILGLFPGNDLTDASLFDRWLAAGSPGNYDVWRFFRGRIPGAPRGLKGIAEQSYLFTYIVELRKSLRSPFSSRTIDFPDGSRLRLAPGVRSGNAARAHPKDPVFRRVVEILRETQARCDQEGTRLLVLLFPTKEEVYLPVLEEPTPHAVQPFLAELQSLDIDYVNLSPHFQERARDGVRLFFEVDGHPNTDGYRLIADVVFEHLRLNADLYGLQDWQ